MKPAQLVNVFETAVNQKDKNTLSLLLSKDAKELHKKLKDVMFVSFNRKSIRLENQDNPFIQLISVDTTVYHCDFRKERKNIDMILIRDGSTGQWKIADSIAEQL